MWVFAPRLSLIIQDRDLHFFTQKKNETVVFFLGNFFLLYSEHADLEESCSSLVCGCQLKPLLLSVVVHQRLRR